MKLYKDIELASAAVREKNSRVDFNTVAVNISCHGAQNNTVCVRDLIFVRSVCYVM